MWCKWKYQQDILDLDKNLNVMQMKIPTGHFRFRQEGIKFMGKNKHSRLAREEMKKIL